MKYLSLSPTKILFDLKSINDCSSVFEKYNRILVLTGKNHLKLTNEYSSIEKFFYSLNKEFLILSEITLNPTTDLIENLLEMSRSFEPDVIVSIGGGSVIDSAKALSVKLIYPEVELWDYAEGLRLADKSIPIVAIPTTSGTGSEVNKVCVLTNTKKVQKRSIKMDVLYPKHALIIPSMTVSMNRYLTATTAIDALSHAIESLVSKKSNFITQSLSRDSIRIIIDNIFKAYNNGSNLEARKELQYASILSGLAIDISGVGLMHALEHPISARFPHVSHGQGLAIVFKKVIEHSFLFSVDRYRLVADAMGIKVKGNNDFSILHTILDAIEYLLSYLDINKKLSDFGIQKSDIKYLSEDVVSYMTNSLNNSPYVPTKDSIEKIYREIL
ncbi:MAG: iron-containing alcohol dehydrogenase [Spirochaetia bacterium]|nr:iron-containing alcohol dehydrogenase [Spirochaetota bacterium]MCX8096697.1 iron-containing alcohol dehydrogenase [Spirochaetota bacterium]MDW8112347.1 iron-containing alcohol dehydrogenase [Spirochaetia bacterium]